MLKYERIAVEGNSFYFWNERALPLPCYSFTTIQWLPKSGKAILQSSIRAVSTARLFLFGMNARIWSGGGRTSRYQPLLHRDCFDEAIQEHGRQLHGCADWF
jgi:hypothetical protein